MPHRTCSIDGCEKRHFARSWCAAHYHKWQRRGDPLAPKAQQERRRCAVDGCWGPSVTRGWCKRHYEAWRKYGDPLTDLRKQRRPCRAEGCGELVRGSIGLCRKHYEEARRETRWAMCSADGCDKRSRSRWGKYCEQHYMRSYRYGDPVAPLVRGKPSRKHIDGYVYVRAVGHPLAVGNYAPEHRKVLYDAIGPSDHACFWCGKRIVWKTKNRTERLVVDHLNAKRDDNRIENLAPACEACNSGRGGHRNAERGATFIAARVVLARHAAEFERERQAILDRLDAAGNGVPTSDDERRQQANAVRAATVLHFGRAAA